MGGKTGFLVRDVAEMVRAIPRIDEIDRSAVRQHVEEHFSARVMTEKYVDIYRKVIDEFKRPEYVDDSLPQLIA